MKVLYVTNLINTGGVGKVVMNYIVDACSQRNDFECDVVSYEEPNEEIKELLKLNDVEYYCLPRPTRNIFLYSKRLVQILKNGRYDAIHTHIEYFNWIPCRLAKINGVSKTVAHAHGQKGKSENFMYRLIEKVGRNRNAKYCDVRLACSEPSGKYVFGSGFELLPNYIDAENISVIDREDIALYDYEFNLRKGHNTIIGFMGYIGFQKNPRLAVEVIKKIHDIEPTTVLLMVGDGVEKEELKKYIEDNNMSEYAFMIGQRTDNLLLMQYFDYLLMPSFSEGMSIALLEAQVSGTPCIVSPGVPSNNDLHMGLYYQANSFSSEDFLVSYKKAQLNQNDSSLEERIEILHQYHNDKESVISKLLSIYRGEIIENKIE